LSHLTFFNQDEQTHQDWKKSNLMCFHICYLIVCWLCWMPIYGFDNVVLPVTIKLFVVAYLCP
jgi:hypothetical protein